MGAISLNDDERYATLRQTQSILGQATSPDDCFLVLRGLETLELRVREQARKALEISRWLETQPLVKTVLFPALESHPGHLLWKRMFSGNGCLLSIVLEPTENEVAFGAFFDALEHLPIGASWGGTHSLIAYYPAAEQLARQYATTDQPIIRLSIGLESFELLTADLERALAAYGQAFHP